MNSEAKQIYTDLKNTVEDIKYMMESDYDKQQILSMIQWAKRILNDLSKEI